MSARLRGARWWVHGRSCGARRRGRSIVGNARFTHLYRQVTQQARIDAGVASGQLTARETNRLDKQQAHIASVEAKDKADGTVTKAERQQLHRMQNHASKNIYQQKHDAQVAAKP
nr:hypothetical protein [Caldimonas sp.]